MSTVAMARPPRNFPTDEDRPTNRPAHPFYVRTQSHMKRIRDIEMLFLDGKIDIDEAVRRLEEASAEFSEPNPARAPTNAQPGTEEKLQEMEHRIERGESPFHTSDPRIVPQPEPANDDSDESLHDDDSDI